MYLLPVPVELGIWGISDFFSPLEQRVGVPMCHILISSTPNVHTPDLVSQQASGGGALSPPLRGLPERWPEAVSVSLTDVCYILVPGVCQKIWE